MSILIKGLDMPKKGYVEVQICAQGGVYRDTSSPYVLERMGVAVPVPPHGRLVDADALINELQIFFDRREADAAFTGNREINASWNDAIYYIKASPTIIEAESTTSQANGEGAVK